MELSNKALAILLLAAMVISLGGTMVSLNRMNQVEYVGRATSDQGIVNLSISETVSITTADGNLINFGSCQTNNFDLIVDSEAITPNCSNYNASNLITNISIRNDGNVDVNVTARASNVGMAHEGTFLIDPTNSSWIAFKSINSSRGPGVSGCMGTLTTNYQNFTNSTNEYLVCSNLTFGAYDSVVTDYRVFVPAAVQAGISSTTLTFTAEKRV
jgi:hypothetical protein